MKHLIYIVEGDTEERFVNEILSRYFVSKGLYNRVQCFKLKHSNGGISKYSHLKRDIINTIYENDVIVTTMIDFYRLPSDFPQYSNIDVNKTHYEQIRILESAMKVDIETTQQCNFDNFIPYIQLHEFESLIFSSIQGFDAVFENKEIKRKDILSVIDGFPNPEDIDNGPNTAPSVRLAKLVPGYDKVLFGVDMLSYIGIDVLLSKCPHFKEWIEEQERALKNIQ